MWSDLQVGQAGARISGERFSVFESCSLLMLKPYRFSGVREPDKHGIFRHP